MSDRQIIVVGYAPGELLPHKPIENGGIEYTKGVSKNKAELIMEYLKGKNFVKNDTSIYGSNYAQFFKNIPEKVLIIGSWLEYCVEQTAQFFLRENSEVLINPDLVISEKGLGKEDIESFLKSTLIASEYLKRTIKKTSDGLIFKQNYKFLEN